jgi:hypothetical protein
MSRRRSISCAPTSALMGKEPEIVVHRHCGESGAIGAGIEAIRLWRNGHRSTFIELDAVRNITYRTTHNDDTRCYFCKNACLRTFIDVQSGRTEDWTQSSFPTKVPLQPGGQRIIVATCEKGAVEDVATMRGIKAHLDGTKAAHPNLVEIAAREVWRSRNPESVADPIRARARSAAARRRVAPTPLRGEFCGIHIRRGEAEHTKDNPFGIAHQPPDVRAAFLWCARQGALTWRQKSSTHPARGSYKSNDKS